MLKPKIVSPKQFIHEQPIVHGEAFGVLCWNTQKLTETPEFQRTLERVLTDFPCLFLLLQEAKLSAKDNWLLPHWSYAVASNIQTRRSIYGVLTASQFAFREAQARLSRKREGLFATHKSYMLSYHALAEGGSLLVVNVHAINFVRTNQFSQEIELIKEDLLEHKGPLIVAGDFNVWSRQRRLSLLQFCQSVGLKQAIMADPHLIKTYRQHPLDFIFYRDLTLQETSAIDTSKVSDHNPLYARFTL
ncbi:endonuclease/exonuclease/phosphatase family protein [Pseudidiomarina homiensis]|uniref:endonuclease/exonuclease/phosphatase family protein n=1 Tax=Pseudidiomarina homiensis TaxID=364198 RepID=UPI00215AA8B7|nr:endonuclease/exonuclease/phosphatase family protein [Pseudidiomarina homiensis]